MKFSHLVFFITLITAVSAAQPVQCTAGSCPGNCTCSETNICLDSNIAFNGGLNCKTEHGCDLNGTNSVECSSCFLKVGSDSLAACTNITNATSSEILAKTVTNLVKPEAKQASCVSTSWLQERGLEQATLGASNLATVLCVPGENFPCGTPGHMLRDNRKGSLMTYREVCEIRADCIESAMLVSKLSHTFDWSQFKNEDGLELTSVSACPSSTAISASRIVAVLADGLNRNGMGAISNLITELPQSVLFASMKFTGSK